MAAVRIVRGTIECPPGEQPTDVDVPTGKGERVISFGLSGGHVRSYDRPTTFNWWAYVTKEEA